MQTTNTDIFFDYFKGVDNLAFRHTFISSEECRGEPMNKWQTFDLSAFNIPVGENDKHFNIYKKRSEDFALEFHGLLKADTGKLLKDCLIEITDNLYGLSKDDKRSYLSNTLFELYSKVKRVINANICIKKESDGLSNYIEIKETVPHTFFQPYATGVRLQQIISDYSRVNTWSVMGPLVGYDYQGFVDFENYKRYLISCIFAYYGFIHNLYGICSNSEIDFIEIQRNRGILLMSQINVGYINTIGVAKETATKDNNRLISYINELNNSLTSNSSIDNKGLVNNIVPQILFRPYAEKWATEAESKYCPESNWGDKVKTELAAFVEIMFEKKYLNGKNRVKTCKDLAFKRYGIDLGSTLAAAKDKKASRDAYKKRLKKYFDGKASM